MPRSEELTTATQTETDRILDEFEARLDAILIRQGNGTLTAQQAKEEFDALGEEMGPRLDRAQGGHLFEWED